MDKEYIKKGFESAQETYDEHASVQQDISETLFKLIPNQSYKTIVELGAGTGYLSNLIKDINHQEFYCNDLVKAPHINLVWDMEEINLPQSDLVVSSSALHWVNDLGKMFKKINESLVNKGLFVFSTFIENNLFEMNDLIDGMDYFSTEKITSLLKENGFNDIIIKEVEYVKKFENIKELFDEFKYTGVKLDQTLSHKKLRNFKHLQLTYKACIVTCNKGE